MAYSNNQKVEFEKLKLRVIEYVENDRYDHQSRKHVKEKNLFQLGIVSKDFVIELIRLTKLEEYKIAPHYLLEKTAVHIFRPVCVNEPWYIKFYFLENGMIFISVHKSEYP